MQDFGFCAFGGIKAVSFADFSEANFIIQLERRYIIL